MLELALLLGGLILGAPSQDGTGRLPRALRLLLSALLVGAAFLSSVCGASATPAGIYSCLILVGMTLSFVGDLFMARVIQVPNRLLAGMIAFGLGHLIYAAAFVQMLRHLRQPLGGALVSLLISGTFVTACWHTQVRKPRGSRVLNVGSLVYSWLIGSMVALTFYLAILDARFCTLAVGALLFLVSDLVLGNWVIRGHVWKSVNDVVWATYIIGQLLIVYSIAVVVKVLS